ncbi:MAG: hypothetical protein BYD32DRAFT_105534 [Podila humilis]|nr:MAG: hypothetical protein BYD32DRAFT_105534 [Podila humilis]
MSSSALLAQRALSTHHWCHLCPRPRTHNTTSCWHRPSAQVLRRLTTRTTRLLTARCQPHPRSSTSSCLDRVWPLSRSVAKSRMHVTNTQPKKVNCQKACKKCDEGRPCTRCVKYGLTDTCVDSTRKVRKKGVKRGPYKRRPPPSQLGTSSSVSTSPTMRNAVAPGLPGYVSEPVTAINSPTQSHMLPFTSTAPMGHLSAPLDFGYDNGSSGSSSYAFHSQRMESNYAPSYTPSYSGASIYASPYGVSSNSHLP